MKAVLMHGYGDVNRLFYGETPDLKPGPGEVLVRMTAATSDSSRLEQLAYEVAAGRFSIPIRREFKLSDIRYADPIAEKGGIGKILLVP